MKEDSSKASSPLRQIAARIGLAKCSPEAHRWEFFDTFPGHEIYECRICRQKKYVELKTGQETYE